MPLWHASSWNVAARVAISGKPDAKDAPLHGAGLSTWQANSRNGMPAPGMSLRLLAFAMQVAVISTQVQQTCAR